MVTCLRALLLLGVLLSSCRLGFEERPPEASPDAGDGDLDVDGDVDADIDVDPDASCLSDELRCAGRRLEQCVDGVFEQVERCDLGCDAARLQCLELAPSNVDGALLDRASAAVVVSDRVQVDTDPCDPAVFGSPAPAVEVVIGVDPELCVFIFESLEVEGGGRIVASGSRPLVLLSATNVDVRGTIEVGATGSRPGPGGGRGGGANEAASGGCGGQAGVHLDSFDSGGGGGGSGASGGDAGASSESGAPGGAGGEALGLAELIPLTAGCGGGGGASDAEDGGTGGSGGHGGGSLQISAVGTIHLFPGAAILAPGSGGEGGGYHSGGGGGGAGGAILLEAAVVQSEGALAANGGGGGGSDDGGDGASGTSTDASAAGGSLGGDNSGRGGAGGAGEVPAGRPSPAAPNTGGGGGAAGRVRLNTLGASATISGVVSPGASETFSEGQVGTR